MSIRPVKHIVQSQPHVEGAGVKLRRAFGFGDTTEFDPFLLFDDFRNEQPGRLSRRLPVASASRDRNDHLRPRGQRRARRQPRQSRQSRRGRRAVDDGRHAASCTRKCRRATPQGRMHGFQLWANLPSSLKMTAPRYQDVSAGDIPEVVDDDGTRVRVICGDFWGKTGPIDGVAAEPRYLDVSVPPGLKKRLAVETSRHAFAYVFAGSGTFRDASQPRERADGPGRRRRRPRTPPRRRDAAIDRSCCSTAATKSSFRPATRASGSCSCRASRSRSRWRGTDRS